jgi:hypothetical protein
VLALILIVLHREVFTATVAQAHPGLSAAKIDARGRALFLSMLAPHAVLAPALAIRARQLGRGTKRARTMLTFLLGLQIAAHATIPYQNAILPGYLGWLVTVQSISFVFEVAALWWLWQRRDASKTGAVGDAAGYPADALTQQQAANVVRVGSKGQR